MAVTFYLVTLGCKVNQYESQALREAWLKQGWQESRVPELADVILVNSCAVTARAAADLRGAVRRLHRVAAKSAIVVTGCAAEVSALELSKMPGVSAVIGQSRKEELLEADWAKALPLEQTGGAVWPPLRELPVLRNPEHSRSNSAGLPFPAFAVSGYDRSRAVLKVQDGCSQRCAYCIVPLVRGAARSRNFEDCLAEARRLLAAGFREIVLSGVNLRQYGSDLSAQPGRRRSKGAGYDFWDLLLWLDSQLSPLWAGRARLRISSLDPGQLGQKALDALGQSALAAPHMHLSLQSGSPSVLERMGRGHYEPGAMPKFFADLRAIWPVFGLGADILTGFPAESEEEFREGLALCQSLPLTYAHVFPYSQRPGTVAAAMAGQVPASLKKERSAALRSLFREKKQGFLQSLLSLPMMRVAFEDRKERDADRTEEDGKDDEHAPFRQERRPGKGLSSEGDLCAKATPPCLRGLNEFYADCRLDGHSVGSKTPPSRLLTAVVPLRIEDAALVVALAANCSHYPKYAN